MPGGFSQSAPHSDSTMATQEASQGLGAQFFMHTDPTRFLQVSSHDGLQSPLLQIVPNAPQEFVQEHTPSAGEHALPAPTMLWQ